MSEILEVKKQKQAIKPPKLWSVILINDDFTSFEFVMECLLQIFGKSEPEAFAITQAVHQQGKGIAGIYTKEIAETKRELVMFSAKENGFPLMLDLQENE